MNIDQGIKQFNGDERQYKTSLITFDSLTLSPSIQNIVEFYQNKDLKSIYSELKQICQSAQIVKLTTFEITVLQFMQFFERVNKQEPNYDYQLHNQLRDYFLKVKETRLLIQQYTGVQLDFTLIDLILQQMLQGQNLNNTLYQQQSIRSNENATYLQDEKEQQQYLSYQKNGISQPRKPNEDCCFIY
ncbi:unnamed protein product [Paramecium sonneborni]|uniref:Uncharacterized protein n=1 Tax=Paramecium sonneborni TaxID=65129 RepID=A0A8S1M8M5_9CILI|nr:unnamed protein product [Paramecium sonneborni]